MRFLVSACTRLCQSISCLRVSIVLLFCIGLFFLAIRRQRKGDDHMWHGPVTSCAWFNSYGPGVKRGNSATSSSSVLPFVAAPQQAAAGSGRTRYVGHRGHSNGRSGQGRHGRSEKPLPAMRQNSGNSSIIGSFSSNEFERGGMINPNAGRSHGSRWKFSNYEFPNFILGWWPLGNGSY